MQKFILWLMRKLFLLLIICPALSIAQKPQDKNWGVSLTPAIIPMKGGHLGIQPGIEYKLYNRLSILTEVAFQTGKKNNADSTALDKKYLRIKPELRYSLSKKTHVFNSYIGLQFSYSFRSFRTEKYDYYYDHLPNDYVYYYDEAKINSPIITTSFQIGSIISDGKNFFMDMYIGLGARFIHTTYSELVNLNTGPWIRPFIGIKPFASYYYSGDLYRFHMNAGIRLIYRFHL